MNDFPKILILSSKFKAGDAVTTFNLFSKWPKECIYCASSDFVDDISRIGDTYRLGNSEIKYIFPFNLIYRPYNSEPHYSKSLESRSHNGKPHILKKLIYDKFLIKVFKFLGIYAYRSRTHLSKGLLEWIDEISPDYIYSSVSNLDFAFFIEEVILKYPKARLIIHGYDDWMEPNYNFIGREYFYKKADTQFRRLLSLSVLQFSTSLKMQRDYTIKYKKPFINFPNPVKLLGGALTKELNNSVVFVGKVGKHNIASIQLMASAIQMYNNLHNMFISFDIYSVVDDDVRMSISKLCSNVRFYDWLNHDEISTVLKSSKVLLLPISIDYSTQRFTKYSMSTKMSEYMSSGRPFIYIGPKDIAMTEFLLEKNISYVITNNSVSDCLAALESIDKEPAEVTRMVTKAENICREYFDLDVVAEQFSRTICDDFYMSLQKNN